MMQYVPVKGLYVYFRYDKKQTGLCALNSDTVTVGFRFRDYTERTKNFGSATDIITGIQYPVSQTMTIPARSIRILGTKIAADS